MTIELHLERAADMFVDNDVLTLRPAPVNVGQSLSGAAWLASSGRPRDAHLPALSHAASLITARLPGYALWLLACHSAGQPNSSMVRHRKLWASLKARGLVTPLGRNIGERQSEGPDGLRFFGALQLSMSPLEPVVAILEAEQAAHLIALKVTDDGVAEMLISTGWAQPSPLAPSPAVLAAVCNADGVVLWPVGVFDDREAGCVAIANAEVIDCLLR